MYSCSKVATVTAALQLYERGEFLLDDPLSFEPGAHWQYSLCHDVLAGAVEAISGKKFSDFVKQNIFEPLEMTNSFYHLSAKQLNDVCQQYFYEPSDSAETDIVKLQMSNAKNDGTIKKTEKRSNIYLVKNMIAAVQVLHQIPMTT